MADKDPKLLELLERLNLPERGWVTVDHWTGDLCAIGVARAGDPERLVHISIYRKAQGRFDYECELAPRDDDEIYAPAGGGEDVSFAELLEALEEHLGAARPVDPMTPE
ncbi:MAG: hypothetical protein U0230_28280 [Polyangiales bacterium]